MILRVERKDTLSLITAMAGVGGLSNYCKTTVLVGDKCYPELQQHGKLLRTVLAIGLVVLASILVFGILSGSFQQALGWSAIILACIVILLVGLDFGRDLGSFDGKYFKFKNSAYHNAFAELNPSLLKNRTAN
jgi:hypothetical protein